MSTNIFVSSKSAAAQTLEDRIAALETQASVNQALQIAASGVLAISVSVGGTSGYALFSHNLGYTPAFLVYETWLEDSSIHYQQIPNTSVVVVGSSVGYTTFDVQSTPNELTVTYSSNEAAGSPLTFNFRFYLFKQTSQT